MEDSWDITESMLSDVLVSNVYDQFFKQNAVLFKDKIVLDVGCRSGMLSYLAIQAGAVKVIAVGNMRSASYVSKALEHGEKAEIFEPLSGNISTIRLPCGLKKVDIIVSEWIGHAIFADSLYSQVLFARDKWLAKHGYIIPNIVNLYISAIAQQPRRIKVEQLPPVLLLDDYINAESVMTEKYLLKTVNVSTSKHEDEFQIDFKLKAVRTGKVGGCMLHIEIGAINAKGQLEKFFANGPESPKTYLKPTLLMLQGDCLEVVDQQLLVGKFSLSLSNFAPRGVEFLLGIWNPTTELMRNKGKY